MSYEQLVQQSVNLAFESVKDLAKTATIRQKPVTDFNFGTGQTVSSPVVSKSIKVIVTSLKKKTPEGLSITKVVLIKKTDVSDITLYDSIVLTDGTWSFGSVLEDNGFIVTVSIFFKEV